MWQRGKSKFMPMMDHVNIRHVDCPAGKGQEERYDHFVYCPSLLDTDEEGACTCPPIMVWPEFWQIAEAPDLGHFTKEESKSVYMSVMECSKCRARVQIEFVC